MLNVLVIEDDRDMAELLAMTLSPLYTVHVCTEKAHAIKKAKEYFRENGAPDVVVIDLIINGEGGLNFYAWMHESGWKPPVIFLTGCHRQSPEFRSAVATGELVYEKDNFSSSALAGHIKALVGAEAA